MSMKPNVQKLLKVKRYWQGFNGTPALTYMATASGLKSLHETLGYGYTSIVEYFYNKTLYYGYSWDDLFNIRDKLLTAVKNDKKYLNKIGAKDKQFIRKELQVIENVKKKKLNELSTKELTELYKELEQSYEVSLGVSHVVEGFSLTCEDTIRNKIQQIAQKNKREFKEIFATLTAPVAPSFLGIVHNKLVKVAAKLRKKESVEKELEELEKNYFWIKNGYSGAKRLDKGWFLKEATQEMKNGSEANDIEASFQKAKQKKEVLIKELNLDEELIQLLTINDFIAELHDRRKEYITITIAYLDAFLEEIGKRYSISQDNMRFLVPPEIYDKKVMRAMTNKQLEQRKKATIFFDERSCFPTFEVYTGKEAIKFITKIEQQSGAGNVKEIKGNPASPGKATGKVKLCKDNSDIDSLKPGEILVACMTQPEFVPAMKKAAAVITDEGGITSHAAIVSRELGKPCIIGTKVATRVLKDGMIVEVDADNGLVKIIT